MQAIYKQRGDILNITPAAPINAGEVVVLDQLIGVAKTDIAAEALGSLALTGVFAMAKSASAEIAIGAQLYWDEANGQVTAEADDGGEPAVEYPALGHAFAAAAVMLARILARPAAVYQLFGFNLYRSRAGD